MLIMSQGKFLHRDIDEHGTAMDDVREYVLDFYGVLSENGDTGKFYSKDANISGGGIRAAFDVHSIDPVIQVIVSGFVSQTIVGDYAQTLVIEPTGRNNFEIRNEITQLTSMMESFHQISRSPSPNHSPHPPSTDEPPHPPAPTLPSAIRGTSRYGSRHRHQKILRNSLGKISTCSIKRIARRGGVMRMAKGVDTSVRTALYQFLRVLLRDTIIYKDLAHRKAVTALDVEMALKRQGKTLYN